MESKVPKSGDKLRDQTLDLFTGLVAKAKRRGATAAEAMLVEGASMSVSQRLGKREDLTRSEGREAGIRVFFGKQQAMAASTDLSPAALETLLDRTLAMAREVPEEPYCGLADPDLLAKDYPDLDLCDTRELSGDELYEIVARTEDAARAVPGVTNSNGASASWGRGGLGLVKSDGFVGTALSSGFDIGVSVVAGDGTNMEMDYAFTTARFASDLEAPEKIGREAGERTVRRLNPRKLDSKQMPVVYEPRVSNGLLGALSGAINGISIARGTSFLRKEMGNAIFSPAVTVVDDPHRRRGLGSRPFDAEGVATKRMTLVDKGVLKTWLLSTSDAKQLGLKSTGHASRGMSSPPGPATSNLYMEPGTLTPTQLMADIAEGVFITNLYGSGVDLITGDYSLGAAGFLIENGKITVPISEFTIAGNLREMFRNLRPANDLVFRYGTDAPTIRVDGMTIAGR